MSSHILVGSTNPVKVNAVKIAFTKCFPGLSFHVEGMSAPSQVDDQPIGDDMTLLGAINRAKYCHEAVKGKTNAAVYDYCVGVEGGLRPLNSPVHDEKLKQLECFAWMAVYNIKLDDWSLAQSSSFTLPQQLSALVQSGLELGEADNKVFSRVNSKQGDGTIGKLTSGLISRTDYYSHAMILALQKYMTVARSLS